MPYAAFSILADFRLLNGIFFFFLFCFFASAVWWHGGQGGWGPWLCGWLAPTCLGILLLDVLMYLQKLPHIKSSAKPFEMTHNLSSAPASLSLRLAHIRDCRNTPKSAPGDQ